MSKPKICAVAVFNDKIKGTVHFYETNTNNILIKIYLLKNLRRNF